MPGRDTMNTPDGKMMVGQSWDIEVPSRPRNVYAGEVMRLEEGRSVAQIN